MQGRGILAGAAAAVAFIVAACTAVPNLDQGSMGCSNLPEPTVRGVGKPTDEGQPFFEQDPTNLSASEIGERAAAAGLVVRYNLQYATGEMTGYGECWCVPPTEGRVTEVRYGDDGELRVFMERDPIPGGRAQPLFGWGC